MVSARCAASIALAMVSLLPRSSPSVRDQRFAPFLFAHQLIRGQKRGVVHHRPAVLAAPTAVGIRIAPAAAGVRVDLLQAGLQLRARTGHVRQQIRRVRKLNHKRLVRLALQHVIQKRRACGPFLVQHVPLAHAGVHQQPQRQGQVLILIEVADRLLRAVNLQDEIVLAQRLHQRAFLVPHHYRQVDQAGAHAQRRRLVGSLRGLVCALCRQARRPSAKENCCEHPPGNLHVR